MLQKNVQSCLIQESLIFSLVAKTESFIFKVPSNFLWTFEGCISSAVIGWGVLYTIHCTREKLKMQEYGNSSPINLYKIFTAKKKKPKTHDFSFSEQWTSSLYLCSSKACSSIQTRCIWTYTLNCIFSFFPWKRFT